MNGAWMTLVVAGCFEVVWAVGLKYTEGFTKPLPIVGGIVGLRRSSPS